MITLTMTDPEAKDLLRILRESQSPNMAVMCKLRNQIKTAFDVEGRNKQIHSEWRKYKPTTRYRDKFEMLGRKFFLSPARIAKIIAEQQREKA